MSNLDSPELLINVKNLPDLDSEEYDAFWENEDRKIQEGVTINGFYFSPFIYWHINLWSIYIDTQVGKRTIRKLSQPKLWDTYLAVDETIRRAEEHEEGKKGVVMVGSRRISKSVLTSSYMAHKAVTQQGTDHLISALNSPDLKVITDYVDLGLRELPEYFQFQRIDDDWKKLVTLGYKDRKTNKRKEWSKIHIRNFDEGNNTEAAAGLTLSSFLLEEGGKGNILNCIAATTPCFDSEFGWRCSPFVIGTSGDMTKAKDLEELMNNPEAYNFLAVETLDTGKSYGLFIPGTKSLKVPREPIPLSTHFDLKKKSELDQTMVYVSDEEKGREMILKNREKVKKSSGMETYLKEIMYYPLNLEECFLDLSDNIFPVELAQEQLTFLSNSQSSAMFVDLYKKPDGSIGWKSTHKKPVLDYPAKPSVDLSGVVQIWEHPIDNAPYGLYTAATDPYKYSQAEYSTSLGATYIYKRVHDIAGESWSQRIVACYVGRPKNIDTWYEITDMLLDYYQAKTLCENQDYNYIQHCISKNTAIKRLERTPTFLRDVHPNTTVTREYGIHSTTQLKQHYYALIIKYMTEIIGYERDEKGEIIGEILGVRRIPDPMLLKEILKFTPKANCDRIITFGMLLAIDQTLSSMELRANGMQDRRLTAYVEAYKKNTKQMFRRTSLPFRRN